MERVDSIDDPRLELYRIVREPQLVREHGVFVAESREVVRILLGSRFSTRSVLVTPTAYEAIREALGDGDGEVTVYVAEREVINQIIGFDIHRGCLAIGERPGRSSVTELAASAGEPALMVALEAVTNPDNVGTVFRSARGFGAAGVVLSPASADPLYRKAIRTSMGSTLRLPFVHHRAWPDALGELRRAGFRTLALHPSAEMALTQVDLAHPRWALLLGNEGQGLTEAALGEADVVARIPMVAGMDSVNVAGAAAIALHYVAAGIGLLPPT